MQMLNHYTKKTYSQSLKSPLARRGTFSRAALRIEPLEDRTLLSTCHVTRLTDQGIGKGFRGDLRYCINKVNTEPGANLIVFHSTANGTINLQAELPHVSDDLIIAGPGADVVTIRRNTGGDYRVLNIDAGVVAEIYGLTLTNGQSQEAGGILNQGTLTLADVIVTGNKSVGTYTGPGGIDNPPGAILTLASSAVTNNIGETGGIRNGGWLQVSRTSISGNVASWRGGGISDYGIATITESTISNNSALLGGGIYGGENMIVEASTIGFNTALEGGGINPRPGFSIRNSTIVGNQSSTAGGGILAVWDMVVAHCTITGNSTAGHGGGINSTHGLPTIVNSIISGNTAGVKGPDMKGGLEYSSHNLFGNIAEIWGYSATDLYNVDPLLGPLQDNGGPTHTIALLPGSPAIDAGDNTDAPEFDQRGPGFPRIVNGTIDIGAFEVQASPMPASDGARRPTPSASSSGGVGRPAPSADPSSALIASSFVAPKGRNRAAQGNALGMDSTKVEALKGRHNEVVENVTPLSPFQGFGATRSFAPRALPWADMFSPFGAETDW